MVGSLLVIASTLIGQDPASTAVRDGINAALLQEMSRSNAEHAESVPGSPAAPPRWDPIGGGTQTGGSALGNAAWGSLAAMNAAQIAMSPGGSSTGVGGEYLDEWARSPRATERERRATHEKIMARLTKKHRLTRPQVLAALEAAVLRDAIEAAVSRQALRR
jgi:hypothetical protein